MSVFFGSVGPDDFARNYANWAKKWGLDGWVDWLGQHATGPRVFWSAIFVTVIYVAIAFGLPSLIKHTKKNTATVVVPISVAFIVIGAVYGGHLIGLSGPNSAELTPDSLTKLLPPKYPLTDAERSRLIAVLNAFPEGSRFPVERQHPVSTASKSLTWRIAPEQVRIGFDHLDERSEIIDAVGREGRYRLFPGAENCEAAILGVHIDADLLQQVLVFSEHFCDAGDCEDVAYPCHGQAA
jgi:hypothetical protein